jgi:hypothetical protein
LLACRAQKEHDSGDEGAGSVLLGVLCRNWVAMPR